MKNLIIIFSLLTLNVLGQSHQEDILQFVDENIGKRVGKGYCYELVEGAIRTYNPSYDLKKTRRGSDRYGKKIRASKVQPGDIVVMSGGTKRKINHVAIVYEIEGELIKVAEQNTMGSLKKSIVTGGGIYIHQEDEYYGKIKYEFFRPM